MALIGTVKGQETRANRNGTADVVLLQVELSNSSDIQTVQYMPLAGDDSPPMAGDLVVVIPIGPSFQVAIGIQDSVTPTMNAGERKNYSRDSAGDIAAFINFLSDGNLELNGNAKTAVRFADLQTAFNELKGKFNAHVHPGVMSGGASTSATTSQSTADISAAESDTVKLP